MTSYPITLKQLEAIKTGNMKPVDEILEILSKADIDSIVGAVTGEGIVIYEKIKAIIKDKKYNFQDVPETIAIGMAVKHIIANIADMKTEWTDIDINEIIVLLSTGLLTIKEEVS